MEGKACTDGMTGLAPGYCLQTDSRQGHEVSELEHILSITGQILLSAVESTGTRQTCSPEWLPV